jgi:SNF2 family DNA or RNA helicase
LARLTSTFVLRRTSDVMQAYLPPRVEQVVFCRMSDLQIEVYRAFLKSKAVLSLMGEGAAHSASALSCITALVGHSVARERLTQPRRL